MDEGSAPSSRRGHATICLPIEKDEYDAIVENPEEFRRWLDRCFAKMPDRLMRSMNRYFDNGQHLHGSRNACDQHCRAWALLYNFTPWHPDTAENNNGWQSPAERLNRHRYHDNWRQNLLVSASLAGYRNHPPQNP